MLSKQTIEFLKTYFLSRTGNVTIGGNLLPSGNYTFNLGASDKRFDVIYARNINAESISGDLDADTVDGFHAYSTPQPNALLALGVGSKFTLSAIPQGHGSGLDADTVDTYHGSDIAKLASAETIIGNWTFNPDVVGAPFIIGINAQNYLVSGLNADRLDGYDSSAFARLAEDDVITGLWTHNNRVRIFHSTSALHVGFNSNNYLHIDVTSAGNTSLITETDGAGGKLILSPISDIEFNPTTEYILPNSNYKHNLGAINKKYLTLHAAELWVESLVAQETIATIGGRILVGHTTILTRDLPLVAPGINLLFNPSFEESPDFYRWGTVSSGGVATIEYFPFPPDGVKCAKLETTEIGDVYIHQSIYVDGNTEYCWLFYSYLMQISSLYLGKYAVWDVTNEVYIVDPTHVSADIGWQLNSVKFTPPSNCEAIQVRLISPDGTDCYAFFDHNILELTNVAYVKHNQIRTGDILFLESTGKLEYIRALDDGEEIAPNEEYLYSVERDIDGTGSNYWYAGDAVFNTGKPGNGFLDLFSLQGARTQKLEHIYNYNSTGGTFSQNYANKSDWEIFGNGAPLEMGSAIYFGIENTKWENIFFNITVAGNFVAEFTWEYWSGSTWTSLSPIIKGDFKEVGPMSVYWNKQIIPWQKTTINNIESYWIRCRMSDWSSWENCPVQGIFPVFREAGNYGPTISGIVRKSDIWNDLKERWALGNLRGFYDYGGNVYGMAAGDYLNSWISVDDTSGFRIMHGETQKACWNTDGDIIIGQVSSDQSNLLLSAGELAIRVFEDEITKFNPDGSGFTASGAIQWDVNGYTVFTGAINVQQSNTPAAFVEHFDGTIDNVDARWTNYTGQGERSLVTGGPSGGNVLRVGNNSGNDENRLIYNFSIPFDPTVIYRVYIRIRRTHGAGTIFIGVAGRNSTDTQWVNRNGENSVSAQHYFAANNVSPGSDWTEYIGYFRGHAVIGSTNSPDPGEPGAMHDNVRYFRPMMLVNYNGAAGITEIDEIRVDILGRDDVFAGTMGVSKKLTVGQILNDAGRIELETDSSNRPYFTVLHKDGVGVDSIMSRLGNMRNSYGAGANDRYGFGVGNYGEGNYLSFNAEVENTLVVNSQSVNRSFSVENGMLTLTQLTTGAYISYIDFRLLDGGKSHRVGTYSGGWGGSGEEASAGIVVLRDTDSPWTDANINFRVEKPPLTHQAAININTLGHMDLSGKKDLMVNFDRDIYLNALYTQYISNSSGARRRHQLVTTVTGTNDKQHCLDITADSTGTTSAGFGPSILFFGKRSTSMMNIAYIATVWDHIANSDARIDFGIVGGGAIDTRMTMTKNDFYSENWATFTSTIYGFSETPTTILYRKKVGKLAFYYIYIEGTSNSVDFYFTIPDINGLSGASWRHLCVTKDNGAFQTNTSVCRVAPNSNVVYVSPRIQSGDGGFRDSGTKGVWAYFWIQTKD